MLRLKGSTDSRHSSDRMYYIIFWTQHLSSSESAILKYSRLDQLKADILDKNTHFAETTS